MWRFIKFYALEIYTVISMMLIVAAAMMGDLSFIQKMIVIDTFFFILHEWEEGGYPGGFVDMVAGLINVDVSDELKRSSRLPCGIFLLSLSVIPFIFDRYPMVTMIVATFGIIEGIVHTVGIKLFRMKKFYTPGMATAWLEMLVSVILISYLAINHLGQWYDYVFGPLIMIIYFGCLQKTMTIIVGIRYSDMPKYLKTQWQNK